PPPPIGGAPRRAPPWEAGKTLNGRTGRRASGGANRSAGVPVPARHAPASDRATVPSSAPRVPTPAAENPAWRRTPRRGVSPAPSPASAPPPISGSAGAGDQTTCGTVPAPGHRPPPGDRPPDN